MWDALVAIRETIHIMELLPLTLKYEDDKDDLLRVKEHHARVDLSGVKNPVTLSLDEMSDLLTSMLSWLNRLFYVAETEGTAYIARQVQDAMYGAGGFEDTFGEVCKIRWEESDDIVKVSRSGLKMMREFVEHNKDQRENVLKALRKKFVVMPEHYSCDWVRGVVDIGKSVEENIEIVCEEARKRNNQMDAYDSMFTMQCNGVVLATKDEVSSGLMSTYISTDYIVKEVVIRTDTGIAFGANVVLPSNKQVVEPIAIWQDYSSQDFRRELFDWIAFVGGEKLEVNHRGIVATIKGQIEQDYWSFKVRYLTNNEIAAIATKLSADPEHSPCLLYEPPKKPFKPIIATKSIIDEFLQGMFPSEADEALSKIAKILESSHDEHYGNLTASSKAVAEEVWGRNKHFYNEIMQGWKGVWVVGRSHAIRQHAITTRQRLFLSRIAGLITRNGKIKCVLNGREHVISFHQKRFADGRAVKACALWDEQRKTFTEIRSLTQLPGLMGMSWKEGVDLMRFITITKHKAMTMGCLVDLHDGMLSNVEYDRLCALAGRIHGADNDSAIRKKDEVVMRPVTVQSQEHIFHELS